MILWRISNHSTLDCRGGLGAPGRWHTRGRRIVCAPNPATALVEVLVHTNIDLEDEPANFRYLEIEAPDALAIEDVDPAPLGSRWQTNMDATRGAGDAWLRSGRTALLRVPSVIVPATWNGLINPLHPDSAQIQIVRVHRHDIDRRLLW